MLPVHRRSGCRRRIAAKPLATTIRRNFLAASIGASFFFALPLATAATHLVMNTLDSGAGSLRQAILDANADVTTPNLVQFQSGVTGTIALTTGQIAITRSMSAQGPGANALTISGPGNYTARIFYINNAATTPIDVTIAGVTLTNGSPPYNQSGGAIASRGANLTLMSSTISGNKNSGGNSGTGVPNTAGGAVYVGAGSLTTGPTLDIESSTFANNHGEGNGGAVAGKGLSQATINQSTFDSNDDYFEGGAMYLSADTIALTHTNLVNNDNGDVSFWGPVQHGGGAFLRTTSSSGTILVDSCVVSGNVAKRGGGGGVYLSGGGPSGGTATVHNSTITNNSAASYGGGGIYAINGALIVSDSTISGNTALPGAFDTTSLQGGGIYTYNAALTMHNTLVAGNTTSGDGGGVNLGTSANGTPSALHIDTSTFSANQAAHNGGGIAIRDQFGPIALQNVTVVGNTANTSGMSYVGGGIAIDDGAAGSSALTIESVTLTGNSAATGGGIAVANFFGGAATTAVVPTLHDMISANNVATTNPDLSGSFAANFNLVRTPGSAILAGGNNLTGLDPQLGLLGNYGGSTPTKLPKAGSPVVNAGDPAATTLTTDQRGFSRVVGGRIDIGAVERQTVEDIIFLDSFDGI